MSQQAEIRKRREAAQKGDFQVDILDADFEELPTIRARVHTAPDTSYEVFVRSVSDKINYCECPDFATNGLGTCKHLEAVIQRLEDPSAAELVAELNPKTAFVYLDATSTPPAIRLQDPQATAPEAVRKLFSSKGTLLARQRLRAMDVLATPPSGVAVAPEVLSWLRQQHVRQRAMAESAKLAQKLRGHKSLAKAAPHVEEGVRFLLDRGRAILADHVVSDRPNQAATAVAVLAGAGVVHRCVVVCPSSRRTHWQQLLIRKTGRKVSIMSGHSLSSTTKTYSKYPFLVVSHADLVLAEPKLRLYEPDLLVVDEGHRIRSWQGRAASVLKRLPSKLVFLLTAPSLLEDPKRLYFAFQLIDPYVLGPYWKFSERHLVRDQRGRVVGAKDPGAIQTAISRHLLARSRDELGKGPFRLRFLVDMAAVQRRLMVQPAAGLLAKLKDTPSRWTHLDRAEVVAYVARLRKLVNHVGTNLDPARSPKVLELVEFLRQVLADVPQGPPALVSTRFRDTASELASYLSSRGLAAKAISSRSDIRDLPEEWPRDGTAPKVVVLADDFVKDVPRRSYVCQVHFDVPWSPTTVKARRLAARVPPGMPVIELELILADTVEHSVRKALVTKGEELARLIPDPASELEALPSTDPAAVDSVVQIAIDELILRAHVPSHLPLPKGMSSSTLKARAASSAAQPLAKRIPQPQRRSTTSSPGVGDIVVVSVASLREPESERRRFGLAVTYSFRQDTFTGWKREYVGHLARQLSTASLVVGWSPRTDDFPVLSGYTSINLFKVPALGLVDEVQDQVGLRIPQDLLAEATLARRRPVNEQLVDQLWKDRRIEELAQALYEDVKLLRDLFVVAVTKGSLFYPSGPSGRATEVELPIRDKLPEAVLALVEKTYTAPRPIKP